MDCCSKTLQNFNKKEMFRTSWTKACFVPLVTGPVLAPNQREVVSCVPNKRKKKQRIWLLCLQRCCIVVRLAFSQPQCNGWQLPCRTVAPYMKRFIQVLQCERSVWCRFGGFWVVSCIHSCRWTDPHNLIWSCFFVFIVFLHNSRLALHCTQDITKK